MAEITADSTIYDSLKSKTRSNGGALQVRNGAVSDAQSPVARPSGRLLKHMHPAARASLSSGHQRVNIFISFSGFVVTVRHVDTSGNFFR